MDSGTQSNSIQDIFDSSLNLEDTHFKQGYEEGYSHGLISGKEESRQVGLKTGFEVGEEVGFYQGCVDIWSSVVRIDPDAFSDRFKKTVKQIKELIERYPLLDPEIESVQDIMDSLRLKFKVITGGNKDVNLVYDGYPKPKKGARKIKMLKWTLACCKVYISETRNKAALASIEKAAKLFPQAPIINRFEDATYNRVGYTLVSSLAPKPSSGSCSLRSAVLAMVKAAFEAIDFEQHSGSHPRLGVVDHICFHPLARASLDQVAEIAKSLAVDVGSGLQVPTFLYGAAHQQGRKLDSIRRELGYFKPNSGNQWTGGPKAESLPMKPDEGPTQTNQEKGVVVIGATQWVDNYNIPIFSTDIAAVRRIAKQVSGRGGGLASVQTMALAHGDDIIEVACNLLEPSKVGGERVQQEVERLAEEEGMAVGKGYFTDLSQEKIIESYLKSSPLI
eukprot:XP_025012901.1 uncharacterized protein LOC8284963 [Ricinus communis]